MKIRTRIEKGRLRTFISDYGSLAKGTIDPESWEFFEMISLRLIKRFSGEIIEKHDGPDASRWVGRLNSTAVYFDFDDMIGTSVSVDEDDPNARDLSASICDFLGNA
jgi:hypothetical protein